MKTDLFQSWGQCGLRPNYREGTQPHPSAENWIKDLLSKALPTRARPTFTHSQSLPPGGFHEPLILIHQRADRMKTTTTENQPNWSHGPQPCLTQWTYEPCPVGPPTTDGAWWRVLAKGGPLEKGMANRFSILALRTPWTVWKGKKVWHFLKNELPMLIGANMLLEKSGEIAPERIKRLSQSRNNTQEWMYLVVKVKSDAVKNNVAQEPGMLGPWIKGNWK